jgi:hypothetical protein
MEPEDRDEQRVQKMFADLDSRARKLGLYLDNGLVAPIPGEEEFEDPQRVMVLASFVIGDRAFSKVVQDPDQHGFDETFREMRLDAEEEEYRRIQREGLGWMPEEDDDA